MSSGCCNGIGEVRTTIAGLFIVSPALKTEILRRVFLKALFNRLGWEYWGIGGQGWEAAGEQRQTPF